MPMVGRLLCNKKLRREMKKSLDAIFALPHPQREKSFIKWALSKEKIFGTKAPPTAKAA